jgi:hypothetical protein
VAPTLSSMSDRQVHEADFDYMIWRYDGDVLDIFGMIGQPGMRYHRRQIESFDIEAPQADGTVNVTVRGPNTFMYQATASQWPAAEALIRRIEADRG